MLGDTIKYIMLIVIRVSGHPLYYFYTKLAKKTFSPSNPILGVIKEKTLMPSLLIYLIFVSKITVWGTYNKPFYCHNLHREHVNSFRAFILLDLKGLYGKMPCFCLV
jgi:hypothetical protein